MSSRLAQVLLGLSLLLNCFVLAGFVYRTWIAPPFPMHGGPPPRRGGPVELVMQDLGLSETQRTAFRAVIDKYADQRRQRWGEIQKLRESMLTELQKPQIDLAKVDSLVEDMTKLRAEQFKQNMATLAEITPQLTDQQRDRLHKLFAERFGRRPPPPRPEGGRPPK